MNKGQPMGYELPECESCVAMREQLAEAHSHLEAQRTATYQAVEREHTAKKQLALAQKGQP